MNFMNLTNIGSDISDICYDLERYSKYMLLCDWFLSLLDLFKPDYENSKFGAECVL